MSRARILADYVSSGDELADKLSLSGGAMTGAITTNSTFDGIDVGTAVAANTAKTGITSGQASAIAANTNKVTNSTSASDLSSGTLPNGRFPSTLPAISGANLTNLPASGFTPLFDKALFGGI